jgi:hypothetical protein
MCAASAAPRRNRSTAAGPLCSRAAQPSARATYAAWLDSGERRVQAVEGRGRPVVVAGEEVDADAQCANVDQRAEGVVELEVQLGLLVPARRVAVAAGEEARVAAAERRVPGGLVVVRPDGLAQGLRHRGFELRDVVAALEAQQPPQAERERIAVAGERDRRPDLARERV